MPDRPPSVDALARELADVGLPHPLRVDAARAAIAAGDPSSARALTGETKRPIRQYFWSPDSKQILFINDKGGDENFLL